MKLHFRETGTGEAVIILHGLLGSSDNWQTFGKNLAEHGYRVIMADLRNHGQSPHDNNFTLDAMADDIQELLRDLGLLEAIITGHSLGGKTAMKFALKYPAMVKKLIVVDISPRKYKPHHDDILNALSGIDITSVNSRGEVEKQLQEQLNDMGVVQWLMKNLYWKNKNELGWRFNLQVIKDQIENTGEEIKGDNTFDNPVLFIKGEKSQYITADDEKLIIELFPNAELITAPGAGHWVHAEKPDWMQEQVLKFLQNG